MGPRTTHNCPKHFTMTGITERNRMNTTVPLSEQHSTRRDEGAVSNFQATPQLAADLQRVLADLIELHLQGKQAHWNVVGKNFRDLHLQLDELVDATREASDTIAERMRALDAVPDGRSDTIVASTSLPQFPAGEQSTAEVVDLITTRIYTTVVTIRAIHDAVDAVDPSTTDLLHAIIDTLEKLAWMVKAENRKI
jgi:starvation-inducible DNA-binding protein